MAIPTVPGRSGRAPMPHAHPLDVGLKDGEQCYWSASGPKYDTSRVNASMVGRLNNLATPPTA